MIISPHGQRGWKSRNMNRGVSNSLAHGLRYRKISRGIFTSSRDFGDIYVYLNKIHIHVQTVSEAFTIIWKKLFLI